MQVWKHGTRGNNIEFANIKLLEKYEPNIHKLIEWKEGYVCQDHEYEYKELYSEIFPIQTHRNQYSDWIVAISLQN